MSTKVENKKNVGNDLIHGIMRWLFSIYLIIFYKVFYLEDNEGHKGWFIKKRLIVIIFLTPIIIPFFMLYGIVLYWNWATNWYYSWIEDKKHKLSFSEKLYIKKRLYR